MTPFWRGLTLAVSGHLTGHLLGHLIYRFHAK